MYRHRAPLAIALVLVLSGLALGGAPVSGAYAISQDGGQNAPAELVVACNSLDVQFDPHHSIYSAEAQIFTGIYEGLFSYNPSTLDPVKAACKTWNKSRDGLTYTFYIREEAVWSDGSPLRASDFRDAWLRALSPSTKADYASFFDIIAGAKDYRLGKNKNQSSVGISVIDDKVLQVKLASPAAYFTRLLCHHSFSPIHPSMLAARDWGKLLPFPVNGPYTPVSWDGTGLVLEKNARYWDAESVSIPRVRITFSDDDADATRKFDQGEIQWLEGPMDLSALLDRGSIQLAPMFGTQYWYFDCGRSPWDKVEVRRALALLLPWKEIRDPESYYMPAATLVLPYTGYDKAKGITEPDATEAASLLEKAGFPGGKGLPTIVVVVPEGAEDAERVSGIMKKSWGAFPDIKVDVQSVPSNAYFQRIRQGGEKGNFTLAVQTWIGDFADPLAFLGMFLSDSNLNDPRLNDAEYDRLLQSAAGKDGAERMELLTQAENRLLAGAAVMPLYHNLAANVIDTDFVHGWYQNALDIHPFKYMSFGQRSVRPNVALLF